MQIRNLSVPGFRTPLQNVWLTPRERQVLRLVSRARQPKTIARELRISHYTVRGYISHMMQCLGLTNWGELILWALANPTAVDEGCAVVGIGGTQKEEAQDGVPELPKEEPMLDQRHHSRFCYKE